MLRALLTASTLGMVAIAAPASAVIIAAQDFNDNSVLEGLLPDDPTGLPGFTFDGSGLGWTLTPNDPPGGLAVGVLNETILANDVDNGLATASNIDGNYLFVENGLGATSTVLSFDEVDTTGFENLSFAFTWAVNGVEFEAGDFFDISINGESIFNVAASDDGPDPFEDGPFVENFVGPTLDISAFDGEALNIDVTFEADSFVEDFGFDDLVISGDVVDDGEPPVDVPAPGAIGLLGISLAGLAFARRRRES
ncbi:MAG: PEP-CTERM sorting domain-containing protein [Pseudomonadota bacterium]